MKNTRLELTWPGKENSPKLEPRILVEQPEYSYHAAHKVTDTDQYDNMLIKGDNLLALKALATDDRYRGKVKCIYIDPPYNTGNAFEHYDDGLEHSTWLSLMKPRLELLRELLSEDGSIWINLDDNEVHYCKVMCDEIFGRINFISNVIWEKKYSPQNDAKWLSDSHDHILAYAKIKQKWRPNLLKRTNEMDARYKNPDSDVRGPWKAGDLSVKTFSAHNNYQITTPSGRKVTPPQSRSWVVSEAKFNEILLDNRIWFGAAGNNVPAQKIFLSEVQDGTVSKTIWSRGEVGDNQDAKKESKLINPENAFATPKPERLLERVFTLATTPGDLVLDSFLGSGTTAAVAHKMGRRWIGIELGEHAYTHCYPRLKQVVDGTDQGGISQAVGWQGGGGFRTYTLAPTLLELDTYGNRVISKQYNAAMLAEALCKLHGFAYQPSAEHYWQHGRSTEQDYLYATTQTLTIEQLDCLSEAVGTQRHLLVLCAAFRTRADHYPNLTIKKIPKEVLHQADWGQDDYSLQIENLQPKPIEPGTQLMFY